MEEPFADREVDEPGGLPAEELLHRVHVLDVLPRRAVAGAARAGHEEDRILETEELAEIGEEAEADVVSVGDALTAATDDVAGRFRGVVAGERKAVVVAQAIAIAVPVAGERVGVHQRRAACPCAVRVEQPPHVTRRRRQHPRRDRPLRLVAHGAAGMSDQRREHGSGERHDHASASGCRAERSRAYPRSAPERADLFQRLAFGLGHHGDDEDQRRDAEGGVGELRWWWGRAWPP